MTLRWALAIAMMLFVSAPPTAADELRPGYLELTQRDAVRWTLVWKAPVLGGLATRAQPAFPAFCKLALPATRVDGVTIVAIGELSCSRPLDGANVGIADMNQVFTDALLRVAPLGRPVQAERLTRDHPLALIRAIPDRWQVARTYLELGIEHILTGYDHLLFVIALVLLLGGAWVVIRAATAFTIAHSLTLAGTTIGLFGLAQAPVEALIALSIVFLADEIIKQGNGRSRLTDRAPWIVAFLFGLIHGFGFAGALREIGLPEREVPMALLTFNIGVEIGQLLIIAAVLALIAVIRWRAPLKLRPATVGVSYVIGTVASFWFLQRLLP